MLNYINHHVSNIILVVIMPAVTISNVYFSKDGKYVKELTKFYPHITAGGTVECYLLEIKDDMGKSVKIFKPFKKLLLKIEGEIYRAFDKISIPYMPNFTRRTWHSKNFLIISVMLN